MSPRARARVPSWTKPIVIGQATAFGDQYRGHRLRGVPGEGHADQRTFTNEERRALETQLPMEFDVVRLDLAAGFFFVCGLYVDYTRIVIRRTSRRVSFRYGCSETTSVTLSTKEHYLKALRRPRSRTCRRGVRMAEFKVRLREGGNHLRAPADDDMVAAALKWEGGNVWAVEELRYGEVQSTRGAGLGSLGLMTRCGGLGRKTSRPNGRRPRPRDSTPTIQASTRPANAHFSTIFRSRRLSLRGRGESFLD